MNPSNPKPTAVIFATGDKNPAQSHFHSGRYKSGISAVSPPTSMQSASMQPAIRLSMI